MAQVREVERTTTTLEIEEATTEQIQTLLKCLHDEGARNYTLSLTPDWRSVNDDGIVTSVSGKVELEGPQGILERVVGVVEWRLQTEGERLKEEPHQTGRDMTSETESEESEEPDRSYWLHRLDNHETKPVREEELEVIVKSLSDTLEDCDDWEEDDVCATCLRQLKRVLVHVLDDYSPDQLKGLIKRMTPSGSLVP
jgi:hypothetical protein